MTNTNDTIGQMEALAKFSKACADYLKSKAKK